MSAGLKIILIDGKFPNYYDLFGVARDASERDIILAYRKLALNEHPDKAGGGEKQNEAFSHINNARDVLTSSEKRPKYNVQLSIHEAAIQSAQRKAQASTSTPTSAYTPGRQTDFARDYTWRMSDQQAYRSSTWYTQMRPHAAYNRFFAPISAYCSKAGTGRFGTKPARGSEWAQYFWKGIKLGQIHETACNDAIMICKIANDIQGIIADISRAEALQPNTSPSFLDPQHYYKRLSCAIELVVELMHFVAESYDHHKSQIDRTIYMTTALAPPFVEEQRNMFEKLVIIMATTRSNPSRVSSLLRDKHYSIVGVLDELCVLCGEWDDFCELPANLLSGIEDTLIVAADRWKNNWQRRREDKLFGYQSKSFVLPGGHFSRPQATDQSSSGQSSGQRSQQPSERTQTHPKQSSAQHPKTQSRQEQNPQTEGTDTSGFSGFAWQAHDWRSAFS